MKTIYFLVRRSPSHSVIAHCRVEGGGSPQLGRDSVLRLLRVSADQGVVPEGIGQLYAQAFHSRKEVREAIVQLMKEHSHVT